MSPDTLETRLGRVEERVARWEQRVEDLTADVRALAPLVVAHAEMRVVIENMQANLGTTVEEARAARRELKELRDHLDARAEEERKERDELTESRRLERKSDRRFWVSTMLAAVTILVAATQVLGGFT
jgi:chromosome segregation ATPase